MVYLQSEKEAFEQVKEEFKYSYLALLGVMRDTFEAKGDIRDTGSPIHHRQPPNSMLSIAQAKCRRIEAIISRPGWEERQTSLEDVIEECVDVANYVLYLASLCSLLEKEQK